MSADEHETSHWEVDDAQLSWAQLLIRQLAAAQHGELYSLDNYTFEQHVALASVIGEAMKSEDESVRAAAVWVLSQLDVVPDDATSHVRTLLKDGSHVVRMAAAWAAGAMREEGSEAIPDLISALHDESDGVRFAAVCSLAEYGSAARNAVGPLIRFARKVRKEHHKAAALKALAAIDPNHPAVKSPLLGGLRDKRSNVRFFATTGIATADDVMPESLPLLVRNLADRDPYVTLVSAWALPKTGQIGEAAVPALLETMKDFAWLEVEHNDTAYREFVSARPDLSEILERILPSTDDDLFRDFRVRFLSSAFHPNPIATKDWINEVVQHKWYLKVQRRRFGHPSNSHQRQLVRELLAQAQAKFAARLLKNPTLGVTPAAYRLLPGFIKNHARNIAWRLRKREREQRTAEILAEPADVSAGASPLAVAGNAELLSIVGEYIDTQLPEAERNVVILRWFAGFSIKQTAAALDLTESVIKTREARVQKKMRSKFGNST